MKTYRRLWRGTAGAMVLMAMAATAFTVPASLFLVIVCTLAMFGALTAVAFQDDLHDVRHPLVKGALLATAPALLPGLWNVFGPAGAALATLLVLASPWVVAQVARRVRAQRPGNVVQAGLADPDDALRRQWDESTRQLRQATSVADRMVVVRVREQILDDMAARNGGQLPGFALVLPEGPGGLDRRSGGPGRPG